MARSHASAAKNLFNNYKRHALQKGRAFELLLEHVVSILTQPCFYCERPPSNNRWGFSYNGIDRLDNDVGYIVGNVVPCCRECNWMKGEYLTAGEARVVAQALKVFREVTSGKRVMEGGEKAPAAGIKKAPKKE